ncbi:uncharacterized protein LOC116186810 isoform X2 [Apis dorsata]|nr:uncharacterized protein LOC116186810 isoform X2 [Apis dorsata]XP_031371061.1 uncharacterized protein LOC116186810 isoform X2 [Apis dorsata]XP_031371062.1 uncharacterized protein LOC116186810 isoform X2 [Apis dorsata]XP_031371063.1 uncharacterized protein LOC116186810 isoform X2 [Apis dorsata]XP_031371064.1 uncharacterized protein LOC116186810 isoform X2 [Apis dorsata]
MVDKLEWLNNEFVQRVLQYNEYDTSINVTNISVKPATSKGDNYASDMYRVTVKYTQKEGKTRVNKETSIVCKFEPLEEDLRKEAIVRRVSRAIIITESTFQFLSGVDHRHRSIPSDFVQTQDFVSSLPRLHLPRGIARDYRG